MELDVGEEDRHESHGSLGGEEADSWGKMADRWCRCSEFNLTETCREFTSEPKPSG